MFVLVSDGLKPQQRSTRKLVCKLIARVTTVTFEIETTFVRAFSMTALALAGPPILPSNRESASQIATVSLLSDDLRPAA